MDSMDILKKIVDSEGSCTLWAKPSICKSCPLSKLKKKSNGSFLSCVEALGVEDLSEEQADAKYKEVASRILIDKAVDDLLGEPDGTK
jgi:hypothetical protein